MKVVSGTLQDALGTVPACTKVALRALLGRRGSLQDRPGSVQGAFGSHSERSRDAPERWSSTFVASRSFENARSTIFHHFHLVVQGLQSAFHISFYSVFLTSYDARSACVGVTKNCKNTSI